jgi:hypothetical protein
MIFSGLMAADSVSRNEKASFRIYIIGVLIFSPDLPLAGPSSKFQFHAKTLPKRNFI